MSKIWRALVIAAVATGVLAVVMQVVNPKPPAPSRPAPQDPQGDGALVDADRLTDEEKDLLVEELIRQV